MSKQTPTGEYEERRIDQIEAGDRVFIAGAWQTVEAIGSWPQSRNIELTTEPDSEGYVFRPAFRLPVAVGEVDARPKGEEFVLRIELGNEAMNTAADVADALVRAAAMVGETGSWEGSIADGNGNTVGRYLLGEAS